MVSNVVNTVNEHLVVVNASAYLNASFEEKVRSSIMAVRRTLGVKW